MEEIKDMLFNHIVERYADASVDVTNGSDMLDSLNIKSDAEYCKQLIDFLIDVKVNYGDSFDLPTTVKYLKQDIMENYVR
jgi:hypothetical protein|tara:strand:- start:397 stop:636 length:240 start_codon:yes stop_codon:yes gene_type:complete